MPQHDLLERAIDYFRAGGNIMLPLILLSLLMWGLVILKGIRFLRERRREALPCECLNMFCDGGATCKMCGSHWQRDIMSRYMRDKCDDPELNRDLLDGIRMRQEGRVMRYITTILVLAAIAPLLGLLGTVTGMITTFDVIAEFGTGNARALASGISEALVTTQSGLVAAVPGLLLGGLLFRRAEKQKNRMELFCIGLQQLTDGHEAEVEA